MPEVPPWVVEALRAGALASIPFFMVAVMWLARKLDEREAARAAADAAHMRTVESLLPLVRELSPSLDAIGRRLEAMDIVIRDDIAASRADRGRRGWWR